MIYTKEDAARLKELLNAPVVRVSLATLGGVHRASLMVCLSLDERDTWQNGILENSRYAHFSVTSGEHKLELFSGGLRSVKFRKCNAESVPQIAEKINGWIAKAKEQPND